MCKYQYVVVVVGPCILPRGQQHDPAAVDPHSEQAKWRRESQQISIYLYRRGDIIINGESIDLMYDKLAYMAGVVIHADVVERRWLHREM